MPYYTEDPKGEGTIVLTTTHIFPFCSLEGSDPACDARGLIRTVDALMPWFEGEASTISKKVNMYMYVYIYVYIYMHVYIHIGIYAIKCVSTGIYIYIYIWIQEARGTNQKWRILYLGAPGGAVSHCNYSLFSCRSAAGSLGPHVDDRGLRTQRSRPKQLWNETCFQ